VSTATVTKPCIDCGDPVQVEIPGDIEVPFFREQLAKYPRCEQHTAENAQRIDTELAHRREVEDTWRQEQRERDCGLPVSLRRLAWEDRDTKAIKAARQWSEGELRGLVLLGAVGRGKTYLAATAAWHRLRYEPLRWTSASALVGQLDGGFGSIERSRAMSIINGHLALIIDDIDKARPTATVAEMLLLAIDQRITWRRPLLVTMNTEYAELASKLPEPFGEAIVSRLRGYCKGYRLGGPDRRVS
jgi:hypothetical protein